MPEEIFDFENAFPADPPDFSKMPPELRAAIAGIERIQNPPLEWRARFFDFDGHAMDEQVELLLNEGWSIREVIQHRASMRTLIIFGRLKQEGEKKDV